MHLATHTSGIPGVCGEKLKELILDKPGQKLSPDQMLDAKKEDNSTRQFNEYSYNDLGYELIGRIIIAVDSAHKTQENRQYGDIVNELTINRVREKLSGEERSKLHFFTSDQIELVDGKSKILKHPELRVEESSKTYTAGGITRIPSHLYDISCGGSYTNPESMALISLHILHDKPEFSIFKNPETLETFNKTKVLIPKSSPAEPQKTYGIGYQSFDISEYKHIRSHGGLGYGSNSNAFVDTKANKAAVCMVSFEQNLTLPLAYALQEGKKSEEPIKLTPKLYDRALYLSDNFSENQLVEMRDNLEKSYDKFQEKYDFLHNRNIKALNLSSDEIPKTSPTKCHAAKMESKSISGFKEV